MAILKNIPSQPLKMPEPMKAPEPLKAPEPKLIQLRAVYGYMVHPFTTDTFDTMRLTTVKKVDSWMQSQLDAGKLTHVAD